MPPVYSVALALALVLLFMLVLAVQARAAARRRLALETRVRNLETSSFDPLCPSPRIAAYGYLGPWPPVPGSIMPSEFPAELIALAGLLHKAPQETAGAVNVSAAGRGCVHASRRAEDAPEGVCIGRGPNGDGFPGLQAYRQADRSERVPHDRHAASLSRNSASDETARGEADPVDRHLSKPQVGHPHTEATRAGQVGAISTLDVEDTRVLGHNGAGAALEADGVVHPDRLHSQSEQVAAQCPCGVDDAEDGAHGCGRDGDVADSSHELPPLVRSREQLTRVTDRAEVR